MLGGSLTVTQLEQEAGSNAGIDIEYAVSLVLNEQQKAVEQFRAGDKKVFGFLVGQVMQRTNGQADPQKVRTSLEQTLAQQTKS